MGTHYDIQTVRWETHKQELQHIRTEVFIKEQACDESEEWDEYDSAAETQHFLAYDQNKIACGTVRLIWDEEHSCRLTRLAVLPAYRKSGIASLLIRALGKEALSQAHARFSLHAQIHTLPMYKKFGFVEFGSTFMEAGIEHINMVFNPKNADGFEQIFGDHVLRSRHPATFLQHSINLMSSGTRQLDICSKNLREDIFAKEGFVQALSSFARADSRTAVRILVHSTKNLSRRAQSLVELTRRLPSKIQVKTLAPGCHDAPESFICVDTRRLIYFNNEEQLDGFCCYKAGPESASLLDDFQHTWHHLSQHDPNLSVLNI